MNKKILFIIAILTVFALPLFAKDIDIDKYEEACCAKNSTTAGMLQCTINANIMWNKELNKYYNLLMHKLSPTEKQDLKSAQLAWLNFRDKEYKNIDNVYNKIQGSMYINISAGSKRNIVKQRAWQLKDYYEDITK